MSHNDPKVIAELKENKRSITRQWVITCPYCGEKHYHGAGKIGDDPTRFLGHRSAHCDDDKGLDRGYFLVTGGD